MTAGVIGGGWQSCSGDLFSRGLKAKDLPSSGIYLPSNYLLYPIDLEAAQTYRLGALQASCSRPKEVRSRHQWLTVRSDRPQQWLHQFPRLCEGGTSLESRSSGAERLECQTLISRR